MTVVTTFKEKRREKQMNYERKILRDISLEGLRKKTKEFFGPQLSLKGKPIVAIEEGSIDLAIESFLLGASYGKFGYLGESTVQVKSRCYVEEKYLIDTLYDYFTYWGYISENEFEAESFYYKCEEYIDYWWKEGFHKAEKRYRMRLH